jgi:hypothetical protein
VGGRQARGGGCDAGDGDSGGGGSGGMDGMGNELCSCQAGQVRGIQHGERCQRSILALVGRASVELSATLLDFKLCQIVLGALLGAHFEACTSIGLLEALLRRPVEMILSPV